MKQQQFKAMAVSVLVLSISACSGGNSGSTGNADGNLVAQSPSVPGTNPGSNPAMVPGLSSGPGAQPATPMPGNPATPINGNSLPALFYNGTSANAVRSEWQCRTPGNTDPQAFYSLRFFEDASGTYIGGDATIDFNWMANDNNVNFAFPGNPANIRLASINFTSATQFITTVQVTNSADDPRQCDLVTGNGGQPGAFDPAPLPTAPAQPDNTSQIARLLSNGRDQNSITDVWLCSNANERLAYVFLDDGLAALLVEDFEVEFNWSVLEDRDTVFMTATANPSVIATITAPVFRSANSFQASDHSVNGTAFGQLTCDRSAT